MVRRCGTVCSAVALTSCELAGGLTCAGVRLKEERRGQLASRRCASRTSRCYDARVTSPTLAEALDAYFARGGAHRIEYESFWVRIPELPMALPNPAAHGWALRCHDLHHVLTGYGTDWVGEAEVSGFELGGGVGRHGVALPFDMAGVALGIWLAPARTFRAFVCGRRADSLFVIGYRRWMLERTVTEMRVMCGIQTDPVPSWGDRLLFVAWAFVSTLWLIALPVALLMTLLWLVAPAPRSRRRDVAMKLHPRR